MLKQIKKFGILLAEGDECLIDKFTSAPCVLPGTAYQFCRCLSKTTVKAIKSKTKDWEKIVLNQVFNSSDECNKFFHYLTPFVNLLNTSQAQIDITLDTEPTLEIRYKADEIVLKLYKGMYFEELENF